MDTKILLLFQISKNLGEKMYRLSHNKSSLFLIELLLVIFFLLLSLSICLRIFFKSQMLSQKSYQLTQAVITSENIAQLLNKDNGHTNLLKNNYITYTSGKELTVYFDGDFNVCMANQAPLYKISIYQEQNQEGYWQSKLNCLVISDNQLIYALSLSHYPPREVPYA